MWYFSREDFGELGGISHIFQNGDFNSCEIMKKTWLNNSKIAICHLAVLLLKIMWFRRQWLKKESNQGWKEMGVMQTKQGKV